MTPDSVWIQIAKEFGFPVVVCASLAAFIWVIGRSLIAELGRLTRAVALVVLAMSFAPRQFRLTAEELYAESMKAARDRKEEMEPDHHPKHEA